MATVAECQVIITGDIGGQGISRLRWQRSDATFPTTADANAAAAAARLLFDDSNNFPQDITCLVQTVIPCFDVATALVAGDVVATSIPAPVTGTVTGGYGAGVGARINWKTATISGRRLLRGSTYMVPYGIAAFTTSGAVSAGAQTALLSAAANYLAAMATAGLDAVIWHRPKPHTTSGGLTGIVTGAVVPITPAGLRSRRS